ncbi:30S ribosomal protein S2 [Candidatus Azambacteria bacterium RIFCSPHIGHO2_01_FULL_44_55]|uniref:Small ribosomal subunit protein uS2 n=1 Tax=Candidatus Azambacteria bacterium RIFCSPLOWO2_02_FULL_44_14 TaxID=1797306 RepID=A0A1F5C9W3_9BACT|nr:MAG: 30S ribosomal protein S2 [Candidatus Azambacteria bacterium RIFCSPLOWO2_01_FULL_44_84]OGD33123.1 MAG: 30S ribosomal protein S2 [Candidatus Azambacteria bacterium RIFCSPHIGHO2_02_FULL_45_18]OGD39633.1 MAG: 30S ribosomal protein S2 [Candidatus Azambacteria bacterium RIFCSPLOWO2_02_FULL_44_14]OGD40866.1 MAG: 30S ribosomal protein S2 [Candidatus Azambacteria bacterium RIFCSPHIGHO2_01_FULL_44_55]OGD51955.1 MAG: 30S ribosomal protein S2 [Candidatus Azambacteria bacterium RIFOXYD1_FULL_44_10]
MSVSNNLKNISVQIEEMTKVGLYLGHQKSQANPKMQPFVWTSKNGFQIIDLEASARLLEKAIKFLIDVKAKGGVILLVGTGVVAQDAVKNMAEALGMPHVTERWLGGTITNWPTISKRIAYLKDLEIKKAGGDFSKYTKYEALKLEEKMAKLEKSLGGLKSLIRLPDAVWTTSSKADHIAIVEARRKNIPVVGLVNTSGDPTEFDYPIPGNDSSRGAVSYVLEKVKDALAAVKVQEAVKAE